MNIGLTYTARSSQQPVNAGLRTTSSSCKNGARLAIPFSDDAEEEFDAPETIQAIADALAGLGHTVELWGDGPALLRRLLEGQRADLVFNIAEGRGISRSREAWVPALLEMFGIPYTGSDPLALAATLDKDCAKRLVREAGVTVPAGVLVDRPPNDCTTQLAQLPLPVIVKPAFEGSSKGVNALSVVNEYGKLHEVVTQCQARYRQPVLVEEFIGGDELTVGILGNDPPEVIGIMRVLPVDHDGPFVYGLDVKRDWLRRVRYEVPAQLSPADAQSVRSSALMAFRALGCRDVARIDFRLCRGVPYFLETNPLPGLAPNSGDLVLLAAGMGIEYGRLIGQIVDAACARQQAARATGCSADGRAADFATGKLIEAETVEVGAEL